MLPVPVLLLTVGAENNRHERIKEIGIFHFDKQDHGAVVYYSYTSGEIHLLTIRFDCDNDSSCAKVLVKGSCVNPKKRTEFGSGSKKEMAPRKEIFWKFHVLNSWTFSLER